MQRLYRSMAGRFEGLNDLEWKLFEDIFPKKPEKRARGMPHTPFRYVLNSLLYILITGCRWCDSLFLDSNKNVALLGIKGNIVALLFDGNDKKLILMLCYL